MRIAILGTGGIGRGMAAVLAAGGHAPVLWSPTGTGLSAPGCNLVATGLVTATLWVTVAATCREAVSGADVILVAVTGNGFRATIAVLAPHVSDGQVIVISGHLSFAGLYLSQLLAERGVKATIAMWATTAVTARRGSANAVHISGKRSRLDVATLPASDAAIGLARCRAMFGDCFEPRANLLAIMLSNLNPPVHMANMLCNLTRAEKGETWSNHGGITPAVARLVERLDAERLAVAAAFGLQVRTIEDHYVASFNVPRASLIEMSALVAAKRPELAGPATLDTRFVTEDVPFGLVPISIVGATADVLTPLHNSGIAIFSALYGRDFVAENDLLSEVNIDSTSLLALCRDPMHQDGRGLDHPTSPIVH